MSMQSVQKIAVVLFSLFYATTGVFAASQDSVATEVTLRYRLNPGDVYIYKVVTDQAVVNGHATRLQSKFQIQALSKDRYNNTRCRLKITSDNERTIRPVGRLGFSIGASKFAGFRLWSQAGAYDAVMDALGRVVTGKVVTGELFTDDNTMGTTEPTLDLVSGSLRPDPMPEIAKMMMPNNSHAKSMHFGETWVDTVYQNSQVMVYDKVRVGNNVEPDVLIDTIIRTHRLDTVQYVNGRLTARLSIESEKIEAFNVSHIKSKTVMLRDVNTGLVRSITETAWNIVDNEEYQIYTSTAELMTDESSPLPALEVRADQ